MSSSSTPSIFFLPAAGSFLCISIISFLLTTFFSAIIFWSSSSSLKLIASRLSAAVSTVRVGAGGGKLSREELMSLFSLATSEKSVIL